MAQSVRVGFIGAGRPLRTEGATGFGMAHQHARAYLKTGQCALAAVADISDTNATAFAETYGIPATYTDYHEMLTREQLDIVSICTWPHLHAPMVIAAAKAGVRAVHCEKPMASTWGDARAMAQVCKESNVQLTFNHQRRYLAPFQTARRLLREGAIGELQRLEAACGDIIDWGTHWIDMLFFYNNETPAEWVIGQIDARDEKTIFGLHAESQAICHFKFQNNVRAWVTTGFEASIGCANRIAGSEGVIEIGWSEPWLRIRGPRDNGWRIIPTEEGIHADVGIERAIQDVVNCLDSGGVPETAAAHALHATEVIFATYESSRRRGRVDLPLTVDDNPFLSMRASGELAGAAASGSHGSGV